MSTKTYTVRSPLLHDGERYDENAAVELTAAAAKTLLALGVVVAGQPEALAVPAAPAQTAAPARKKK